MFYEIDVGKYSDKYIKKGREKCQVVIINAFHSHWNLSSLSNSNQQVEIHWGPSDFDYIFSAEEEQQMKESTDNGGEAVTYIIGACTTFTGQKDIFH